MNLALLATAAGMMAQAFGGAPQFQAKLFADADAIQPGRSAQIAIVVTIADPWHIYHRNPLSTGYPTTFVFDLPDGFSVGEIRYPQPKLSKMAGIEYLGYGGTTTFLATLSADKSVETGAEVTLKVKVNALACLESCIPVDAKTSMKLAVKPQAGTPANAKVFDKARKKLPPPLAKAPQIKSAQLILNQDKVRVGDELLLTLVVELEDGWHMQDRDPGVADLIPARLFIEPIPGFEIDEEGQKWSKPVEVDVPGLGKVRQHDKRVVISTPIKLTDSKVELGERKAWILFQYQACNDEGVCALPQLAEMSLPIEIVAKGTAVETIAAPVADSASTGRGAASGIAGDGKAPNLLLVFLGAFAGGIILNIMPCVLPVISLKIFGFVQQAGENRGRVFLLGLVYASGIMASFLVLAILMSRLDMAWGGIMQSSVFVTVLSAAVLAFALSLFGVFEIQLPGSAMGAMNEAATREGIGGSFMNGVFATALATPCTAPILAPALGILAQLPPLIMGAGIMTVGAGLAAPYVLLTAFPAWLRFLPKPGAWMITFKQFMGFVLLGTVVWLMWTLFDLVDKGRFFTTLSFFCAVGLACWMIGRLTLSSSVKQYSTTWAMAAVVLLGGWFGPNWLLSPDPDAIQWRKWEPGLAETLSSQGYTVYVDFTATWCATCQTNKALVLESDAIRGQLTELSVVPLKADFTKYDPVIQQELKRFQRAGVPLNIILPAGKPDDVIVLPALLTRSIVSKALDRAGKSTAEKPPDVELASAGLP